MNEKGFFNKLKIYLIFAGPTTFAFFAVIIIPFIFGIYLTFTDWNGLSSTYSFVKIANYISILYDSAFWTSFLLTLKYVFYTVVIVNVMAFTLAYFLTSGIKGENFLRAGFFIPNLIAGIVLGLIWRFIFSRVLVYLGQNVNLGIFSTSWLGNPDKAFWTLVIVSVWQYSGYMMLIYIAGFMNVPKSVLEAATIDGASSFQKVKSIIAPLMIPSFIISIFLTLQRAFLVYDVNLALTNGDPFKSTELLSLHIYRKAFLAQDYAIGQSQAFFFFLIVAGITFTQVYFSKKLEVEQ
ncbi:ABC transporter permease subunit [Iocasia frigidifontis]|uniref:ABC transporter permease subunit n=1 Tax=Iocasia fonsfrigidae TaxID=2682810 RepID=A0A8A7KC71_9FIRM|nr:sugar ABC transporter permease [Iocasia fonsfrigidae]QTL96487.1 ABC transporter permease subunit [Iocasia fonsfrigidae]